MPKILCFARHAEYTMQPSEQVTPEGFQQVRLACSQIQEVQISPDLIITSPVLRACQTANAFREGLSVESDVRIDDAFKLVDFPRPDHDSVLIGAIRQTDDAIQTLFIVTHQPQVESFAQTIGYTPKGSGRVGYAHVLAACLPIESWSGLQYFSDALGRGSLFPMPEYKDVRYLNARADQPALRPLFRAPVAEAQGLS